ncbi:MAG: amidohydrolase family protein [Gammaproteobacteria bacterium]|nr:amidohydrolase family protein [Gammaproteobacteria bacterium]
MLLALLQSAAAGPAPDRGSIAIRCGSLIDGIGETARARTTVVIKSGRFSHAGAEPAPADSEVLDLSAYTCLPGLIDTHVHIADHHGDTKDLRVFYSRNAEEQADISRHNAEATLLAGFTSVRSVGAYIAWAEIELRDRVNRGEVIGPRIQAAGIYLTIPGGGGDLLIPGVPEQDVPAQIRKGVARGPEQFREKAELAVRGGADLLKVIASGAVLAYGGVPGAPEMTPQEIATVVKVGHAAGIKVAAHAHGAQSIKEAILAGVDTIEHASLADDEAIALAADRRVAFSMDVYNGDYIATEGREEGWPEEFLRKNDETTEAQRQVFAKAYRAGVPLVYGTDAAVYPHGLNARQFEIMVQRGMSPMDAIRSATSVAAEYMGWGDRVGAIAAGRYGDLIAVRGDPLADIRFLQDVKVVIKGGVIYKQP